MTEREQFEAWAAREYGNDDDDSGVSLARQGDGYLYSGIDDAWNGWKASRRAALEEAAKVCDERSLNFRDTLRIIACEACANAIRALSKGETE